MFFLPFLKWARGLLNKPLSIAGFCIGVGVAIPVASFTTVTLHECSHVVVARVFGLATTEVEVTKLPWFTGVVEFAGIKWQFIREDGMVSKKSVLRAETNADAPATGGVAKIPGAKTASPGVVGTIAFAGAYGCYLLGVLLIMLLVKVLSIPKNSWKAETAWCFVAGMLTMYSLALLCGMENWIPRRIMIRGVESVTDGQVISDQLSRWGIGSQISMFSGFALLIGLPLLGAVYYALKTYK